MKFLRYSVILILVFVFGFLTIVGSYVRSIQLENIIDNLTTTNNKTTKILYDKYLWAGFGDYLVKIYNQPISLLETDKYLILFRDYVKDFTKESPVVKLAVYTPLRQKLAENNSVAIKEEEGTLLDNLTVNFMKSYNLTNDEMFRRAIAGIEVTKIISTARVTNDSVNNELVLIRSLVPITKNNQVQAVVEIYYDITKTWDFLSKLQIIVSLSILSIITIIFLVLIITSIRAQRIIDKQIEINLELEEAKKKAEEVSQHKSMFLANMSHELRTPLNSIIGFSDIIKNEGLGPIGDQKYKEYGNDINSAGTHLLSLINDILDFSKAEADRLQVEMIEVDVIKMIKQCLRIVLPKADEAHLSLVDNTADIHYILIADPKRLKQVFLNVLSNAIKFTPENGSITVSTEVDGDKRSITIKISDTGIGIAPKDIAKVMQPFIQVENSLSKKHSGTGLGLPLTKKLVELMQGKFHIDSEPGLGTTVVMTFHLASTSVS
ncbi:MAG: sensor histidine kinase [Sphingobacteriia bacterium]|nr:sensor histidine kinase [Sphingobacteriia bacterium]